MLRQSKFCNEEEGREARMLTSAVKLRNGLQSDKEASIRLRAEKVRKSWSKEEAALRAEIGTRLQSQLLRAIAARDDQSQKTLEPATRR